MFTNRAARVKAAYDEKTLNTNLKLFWYISPKANLVTLHDKQGQLLWYILSEMFVVTLHQNTKR